MCLAFNAPLTAQQAVWLATALLLLRSITFHTGPRGIAGWDAMSEVVCGTGGATLSASLNTLQVGLLVNGTSSYHSIS